MHHDAHRTTNQGLPRALERLQPWTVVGVGLPVAAVAAGIAGAVFVTGWREVGHLTATESQVWAPVQLLWAMAGMLMGLGPVFAGITVLLVALLLERAQGEREAQTAFRAALGELGQARDLAEQASRTKSNLIARVSHELRTPINGVVGITEVLLRDRLAPGPRTRVEVLDHSARALRSILDELLDVSRGEMGHVELARRDFRLPVLLRERVALHQADARAKGLELLLELDDDLPGRVHGDPVRIGQVVGNLVDNAIKYTPHGLVRVQAAPLSRGVALQVVDTGPGIAPADRDRIFEPFVRADTPGGHAGSGLGLTVCRQLVEAMGGRIDVGDGAGGGTRFVVSLPLPSVEATAAPAPAQPPVELGEVRVLGVDDNPVNLKVLGAMLASLSVPHDLVASGERAVALARQGGFDVILMDVEMPGMDGREATVRLRDAGVDTPVVAFTAHAMVAERQACLDAGMVEVLAKPVTMDALRGALGRWGGERGASSDRAPVLARG